MNKSIFFSIPVYLLAIFCMKPGLSHCQDVTGKWYGTMSMETTSQSQLLGNTTIRVFLTISENVVTGSVEGSSRTIIEGKEVGNASCTGAGTGQLWRVAFSRDGKTYDLEAISPLFTCTKRNLILGTTEIEQVTSGLDLAVDQQPMGANRNVLIGTKTETADLGGDLGTSTTTITWSLTSRPVNAELIVSPVDYDFWLPKPGRDELTKGSVMTVNLKVRSTNSEPLRDRVRAFELTLKNTSIEPGITINFPVSPRANQLPDLRFLPMGMGESISEDQSLYIRCNDGSTGYVKIGSYDGGGWTVLSAVAILENDIRLQGHLFESDGETDIRIPKRDMNSKIAKSWLVLNSNPDEPGEMDDKEESDVNHNKGDGLTVYEEYRGVMSKGTFQRLTPQKKELGILLKQTEYDLFKLGLDRFENASGVKIYVFGPNEIPDNRRLNQNARSAHDFDQYVLRLSKGNIRGERDIYGFNMNAWGICYPHNDIPARVTHVAVDVDMIRDWYQATALAVGARNLPFTAADIIASTTAHEIGHGVSLPHHGNGAPSLPGFVATSNPPRVFHADARGSWEIFDRPTTIDGTTAAPQDNQSGNVSCFMCYRNVTRWARIPNNTTFDYYQVPMLRAGSLFCIDKEGTGINADNKYFGNGIHGNCLGNIKLR